MNLSLFLVKPNKCHIIIISGTADAWLLFFNLTVIFYVYALALTAAPFRGAIKTVLRTSSRQRNCFYYNVLIISQINWMSNLYKNPQLNRQGKHRMNYYLCEGGAVLQTDSSNVFCSLKSLHMV